MLICLLLICTLLSASGIAQERRVITVADPTIFYHEHTYYLYGTADNEAQKGFKVYISKDKKSWKDGGTVLKKEDVFGTSGFWAPQIFKYQDKFYLAYVADERIAIAESDGPKGPFTQKVKKAIDAPVRIIDPFIFFDSGKIYLYHVRLDKGNRIYVTEMNSDLLSIKEETSTECIHASENWENTSGASWTVTEGPSVLKRGNVYYMFYSANDFRNPDYAVGYATSDSPYGPWVKYKGNPILSKLQTNENGSGHGDFFEDEKGKFNYVFHTHESNNKPNGKRRTAIILMKFLEGKHKTEKLYTYKGTFRFLTQQ
ncbi:beta-xylosidase [Pedobacter sp. AK017]|uniref:glycoside hydrolase family 43 protein n=1 Tax=Pedobacter sp. AK017 TaxID=2723073 RepID=UPI00030EE1C8|nr:glycoside hydrolase family 43 protein [Pedobacter sp. AK017]MBB5437389.1 beta-xylosidase [Pedobacter sp. AK017]